MEGTSADGAILAQEDIDVLLDQADKIEELEGSPKEDVDDLPSPDDKEEISTSEDFPEERSLTSEGKPPRRSDEDVKAMLFQLCNKAFLKRDEGIQVIWNASGTFPMTSGLGIKIQRMEYVSLGVLNKNHLIVGQKNRI